MNSRPEEVAETHTLQTEGNQMKKMMTISKKTAMAILSSVALLVGSTAGPLLIRYYFQEGGAKKWLSTFQQTSGFPLLLPVLWHQYKKKPASKNHINTTLFIWSTVLGIIMGALDFLYSYGLAYLPVSTSQVLLSSSLAFTALFAYLIAKQKINLLMINGVVLLTMSSVLLAFRASTDRPGGVTKSEYSVGFAVTVLSTLLNGLTTPLVQVAYQRSRVTSVTLAIVLEMQVVMSAWATLFSLVGLLASKEFMGIRKEAAEFTGHGVGGYVLINVSIAIVSQISFAGMCGVTLLVNSVWSGMLGAATIPLAQLFGVLLYGEKFQAEKGMSTAMAIWGIASYVFGEFQGRAKDTDVPASATPEGCENGIELSSAHAP